MHFSVYYRLVDLLWDHLSDEELFRRLAREALERYIDYKKEEEKKKTSQANDHIRGISSAISKMERNAFLSASDRALAELSRSAEMLSVDNDHRKVISELKEKVYSWRFGGVNFSQEDMENMLEKIKLVKSEMEAAGR